VNNILALFHLNEADCTILPASHIVDYKKKQIDIPANASFLKLSCKSVDEAKRRAAVVSLLTYDLKKELFVKLSTAEMLENPFVLRNAQDCSEAF